MGKVSDLRKAVKRDFPHLIITVKTVGFFGVNRQCLKVSGDRTNEELAAVNGWAKEAGLLPDGNLRWRESRTGEVTKVPLDQRDMPYGT